MTVHIFSGETLPSPKIEKKDREIRLERQKLDELNCTGTGFRFKISIRFFKS